MQVERPADGGPGVLLVTADETARARPACGVFATRVKDSAVTRPGKPGFVSPVGVTQNGFAQLSAEPGTGPCRYAS